MTQFVTAVFHAEIRTVEFTAASGDRMLRSGGTIAWLLNNPGNLRPSARYRGVIGEAKTKSGRFAIFESEEAGRTEKRALLKRKYDDMTLRSAIFTYAPESENDSEAYLAFVRKRAGVTDSTVLKNMTEAQFAAMMGAMEQYEGFNAKKETRNEAWVHVTTVTLSSGAKPTTNLQVTVQADSAEPKTLRTNQFGRLPPFITRTPGEKITLTSLTGEPIGIFELSQQSRTLLFSGGIRRFAANADSHLPPANPVRQTRHAIRYIIQPGDTLDAIARRFKTSALKIMSDNCGVIKRANLIFPGQVIWLHGRAPSRSTCASGTIQCASGAHAATAVRHTVRPGENLAVIAKKYGTTLDSLILGNSNIRNPALIRPGQIVVVTPDRSITAVGPGRSVTTKSANGQLSPETVRARETRSRANAGHPLGIVPFTQERAPWIEHAYAEAERWKGKKEVEIGKEINYHHELGTKWLKSLSGSDNAWCASYVNWCLREAGYPTSTPHYRASSFHNDASFQQIARPVFGAIAMKNTSHVAFVYAKTSSGSIILLGGNQGDQINFSAYKNTGLRFYVPLAYATFAKKELEDPKLDTVTASSLNDSLGIKVNLKASGNER